MILEYVDDLINSNIEQKPSFYDKHKGKLAGLVGVGLGAGAYHLLNHQHHQLPTPVESSETFATKAGQTIKRAWSDLNRPLTAADMSQSDRLGKISQLEQHKSLYGDSMTNSEYTNLNGRLDELRKYSNR